MYGTVARLHVKPGMEEKLRQLDQEERNRKVPGFVFEHVYRLDSNPNEYLLVVGFTDREAYRANADSPDQNARYVRFRELLTADPEWHDGEIIASFPSA
jgi:quinol monooxygenase YgiN